MCSTWQEKNAKTSEEDDNNSQAGSKWKENEGGVKPTKSKGRQVERENTESKPQQ
jgi:hypothetical protein